MAPLRRVPSLRDYNPGKTRFASLRRLSFPDENPCARRHSQGFWVKDSLPCDAAEGKWTFCDQAGKCLSAASFCPPVKRLRSAGDPQGKELGRLFLPTLFWRVKRVGRRAGAQPCGLDLCIAARKTGSNLRIGRSCPARRVTFLDDLEK